MNHHLKKKRKGENEQKMNHNGHWSSPPKIFWTSVSKGCGLAPRINLPMPADFLSQVCMNDNLPLLAQCRSWPVNSLLVLLEKKTSQAPRLQIPLSSKGLVFNAGHPLNNEVPMTKVQWRTCSNALSSAKSDVIRRTYLPSSSSPSLVSQDTWTSTRLISFLQGQIFFTKAASRWGTCGQVGVLYNTVVPLEISKSAWIFWLEFWSNPNP